MTTIRRDLADLGLAASLKLWLDYALLGQIIRHYGLREYLLIRKIDAP